jgi:hypothetical protein
MKEKPACRICFAKFTRRGNMLRHMEDIHGVRQALKKRAIKDRPGYQRLDTGFKSETTADFTEFDKHQARILDIIKLFNEYTNGTNLFQTINNLRSMLVSREKQIQDISTNYYLMPLEQIKGVSGFICRTCNQLGCGPIRDIGFDLTKHAHHKCDQEKVKGIKMCSIRKSDLWNLENYLASLMIEFLNFCMPGRKYIISEDMSLEFADYEERFGLESAKKIFGIPDRMYFHSVGQGEMKEWIKRMLRNVGKKIP